MSQNIGVFVDVSNLFYSAKSAGVEVNYCRLLDLSVAGRDLIRACAYTGVDPDNPNQRKFIDFLRANGYKVVCKDIHKYEGGRIKANLDIEMAVDIMLLSENLDVVVSTADPDSGVRSIGSIRTGGVLVSVVGAPPAAPCAAARIRCAITGPVSGEFLGALTELADHGRFHINIDQRLPLADAAKAWELNRAGHTGGKIILEVSH